MDEWTALTLDRGPLSARDAVTNGADGGDRRQVRGAQLKVLVSKDSKGSNLLFTRDVQRLQINLNGWKPAVFIV